MVQVTLVAFEYGSWTNKIPYGDKKELMILSKFCEVEWYIFNPITFEYIEFESIELMLMLKKPFPLPIVPQNSLGARGARKVTWKEKIDFVPKVKL